MQWAYWHSFSMPSLEEWPNVCLYLRSSSFTTQVFASRPLVSTFMQIPQLVAPSIPQLFGHESWLGLSAHFIQFQTSAERVIYIYMVSHYSILFQFNVLIYVVWIHHIVLHHIRFYHIRIYRITYIYIHVYIYIYIV